PAALGAAGVVDGEHVKAVPVLEPAGYSEDVRGAHADRLPLPAGGPRPRSPSRSQPASSGTGPGPWRGRRRGQRRCARQVQRPRRLTGRREWPGSGGPAATARGSRGCPAAVDPGGADDHQAPAPGTARARDLSLGPGPAEMAEVAPGADV